MKKYLAISANRIKEDLTYREHFFTLIIMTAVYCVVLYFIWKAIYGANGTLNGMTFEQSYVSMVLTFAMLRDSGLVSGCSTCQSRWQPTAGLTDRDHAERLTCEPCGSPAGAAKAGIRA